MVLHHPYQLSRALPRLATILPLSLLLGAGACGEARQTDEPPEQQHPAVAPRPDALQDTLLIEGMPEATTLRLFTTPGFATPFSTYVPDGIDASIETPGDTGTVRFTASFTGKADPNAYMHVRIYATGTELPQAREMVAGFLRSRRPVDDPLGTSDQEEAYQPVDSPEWGLEAYSFQYEGAPNVLYVGRAIIASHGARLFHVLMHYPAEYGDGLVPRFDRTLDLWRWDDTNEMLRR
ncbi:hypothetical protein BH23GEM9_BH23GEM9_01910 [soil metagenome]